MVGGGSGHYPAFCGVVGPGLRRRCGGRATSSPPRRPRTPTRSARLPASDGGLLFSTGNYAGDVMNFTLAQQRLAAEGDRHPSGVRDRRRRLRSGRRDRASGVASPVTSWCSRWPVPRQRSATTSTRSSGSPGTRTTGPAPWASRSPAARCRVPIIRCSPCRTVRWVSGSASTASPVSPRRRCRGRRPGRHRWWRGCWPRRRPTTRNRVGVILNGLGTTKYEELFVVWRTRGAAAPSGRLHDRRPGGRRAGDQPRHGRLLAHPGLPGR